MHTVISLRAWRAIAFVLSLALLSWPIMTKAAVFGPMAAAGFARLTAEPFGQITAPLPEGALFDKWVDLQKRLGDEQQVLDTCRTDPSHCPPAAQRFLAIVDSGRNHDGLARFGDINRAINMTIKPVSDLVNYGAMDVWSAPLATLSIGSGDCEDYAIAKLAALKEAGVSPDDLRLVIVRDHAHAEDHAVAMARWQGRWLVLDNRRLVMLEDSQIADYQPSFVIDEAGVRRYLDLPTAQAPLMASRDRGDAVPSSNAGLTQ